MAESESQVQRERQKLQGIFRSVTGETVITDRQDQETHKKVNNLTESDSSPG